jgi:photosystem II stability/assembly factor-like uncharacterized protein
MAVDLTLNRFMVPNLPDFNNAFGVKKAEAGRGCSTEELVANMMLPFLRSRPVDITGNTTTSTVEANAVLNLAGNITTLTLGPGAYTSVELLIMNNAQNKVKLIDGSKNITLGHGDVLSLFWDGSGWWQNPKDYPVGKRYDQRPNDPEPAERWLPGTWALWTHRAEKYGLSQTPPPETLNYKQFAGTVIGAIAASAIQSALYANGKYLAAGDGGKLYIGNGRWWLRADNHPFSTSVIRALAYGNGKFIAAGDSGKMAYSEDGVNWTAITNHPFAANNIFSVAYGNGVWVAVGAGGKIAYSEDGETWVNVTHTLGAIIFYKTIFADGKFYAAGQNGKMAWSEDGIDWTAVTDPAFSTTTIISMAYSGEKFIAVGESGKMSQSTDGLVWAAISPSPFATSHIRSIIHDGSRFIAGGDSGKMYYSEDGAAWGAITDHTLATNAINAMVQGDDKLVIGGAAGKIAYTADGENWTAVTDADNKTPYVMYHLAGDDYTIYRFKLLAEEYTINEDVRYFDTVKWEKLETDIIVERIDLQPGPEGWGEDDYVIGEQIEGGEYDGYYVVEINVLGGKFLSFAGGNRPTSESGAAGDVQRNVKARVADSPGWTSLYQGAEAPFYNIWGQVVYNRGPGYIDNHQVYSSVSIDLSLSHPTGPEGSPRTMSIAYWRRMPDPI